MSIVHFGAQMAFYQHSIHLQGKIDWRFWSNQIVCEESSIPIENSLYHWVQSQYNTVSFIPLHLQQTKMESILYLIWNGFEKLLSTFFSWKGHQLNVLGYRERVCNHTNSASKTVRQKIKTFKLNGLIWTRMRVSVFSSIPHCIYKNTYERAHADADRKE